MTDQPMEEPLRKVAYYGFTAPIESGSATRLAAALNLAVNNGYDEVQLCFSSLGGYVADGIYLYNHIRALPIAVVAHNTGSVSSIALVVFVAAVRRYCSAHAMFMTHPTSLSVSAGTNATVLQTTLDAALADDLRTENILRERCSLPDDILAARRAKDVHISPAQAAGWGLVHGIAEFSLPRGEQVIQI